VYREILRLSQGSLPRALWRTAKAFRLGWHKSTAVDLAESLARAAAPFASEPSQVRRLLDETLRQIERARTPAELARLRREARSGFAGLPRNGRRWVPRVKLVGESYCTLEPFINFDIIRRLGEMGVVVDPFLTAHRWLGFHAFRIGKSETAQARKAAREYWRMCVGGEDENSVGHLVLAARSGFDGVVHVHPFGCMPGTVVQPSMARASQDYDIPFLSMSLDEHTSETGVLTRLEAFVSLLKRRGPRAEKGI
jgi:predicted nucleotide-binding protein (sugar kinase/HSP70/actin superfamily)